MTDATTSPQHDDPKPCCLGPERDTPCKTCDAEAEYVGDRVCCRCEEVCCEDCGDWDGYDNFYCTDCRYEHLTQCDNCGEAYEHHDCDDVMTCCREHDLDFCAAGHGCAGIGGGGCPECAKSGDSPVLAPVGNEDNE